MKSILLNFGSVFCYLLTVLMVCLKLTTSLGISWLLACLPAGIVLIIGLAAFLWQRFLMWALNSDLEPDEEPYTQEEFEAYIDSKRKELTRKQWEKH